MKHLFGGVSRPQELAKGDRMPMVRHFLLKVSNPAGDDIAFLEMEDSNPIPISVWRKRDPQQKKT